MSSELETKHHFDLAKLGLEISLVFEHVDAAVLIVDQNRKVVAANGLASDFFGYDNDALVGQETRILFDDPADFEELGKSRYNDSAQEGFGDRYVVRYRRKDGSVFDGATVGGAIQIGRAHV